MSRLKRHKKQRGVALLLVLLMVSLTGGIVADFQYNSHVDYLLAINARDELQAEYNALSALRMRALLLKHSRRLKGALDALGGAVGLDANAMPPISQIIEMVPVECGMMSAITKEAGSDALGADADAVHEDFFNGECVATATSEHSKIALSALGNSSNRKNDEVKLLLLGLLSDVKLERHFEEDDRNGAHADGPLELVGAIADWVDSDEDQTVNKVADEGRLYDLQRDSYRPKNAPFDSLAELQLVHGIDDELYEILRDNVSIYNDNTKIELATAPLERIFSVGLAALVEHDAQIPPGALVPLLADLRDLKMSFGKLTVASLKALIQTHGLDRVFDVSGLSGIFTDRSNPSWYTIEAQGRVGNVSRRIRAVFQAQEGRFYHVRIE